MKNSNPNPDTFLIIGLNYTKLFALKSLFLFLLLSCAQAQEENQMQEEPVLKVGAERVNEYLPLLKDKSVGFVGNQTSMIDNRHAVDSLLDLGVKIVRVFSPEHGFRGTADAGEHVTANKDEKTGLSIYSLYGKQKKPDVVSLKGIDVMVFDIQDVGVRFYTYISTLHYVMEACSENKIPLIVLDRPNPNGHYVDGPVLDMNYKSFVGMHPIPTVHGMTIGEYAKMINGEGWLPDGETCELTVIPVKNYTHKTPYSLPIPPSPNLRSDEAIQLYPSLCLLEATQVSVGRGTEGPFECYGHPDFPKTEFSFIPRSGFGSKSPKFEGEVCNGYNLKDSVNGQLYALDLSYLIHSYNLLGDRIFEGKEKSFNLLAGNGELIKQIKAGKTASEIRETWETELDQYKTTIRSKYLIYE